MTQLPPSVESNPEPRTILVAEDEVGVRLLVIELLQMEGYRVLPAANGAEALILASRHAGPIHLLLSDVAMPGMSGPALARRLRETRPQLPLLFISGYSDPEAMHEIQQFERAQYLRKPFAPRLLRERIAILLADTP